MKSYENFTEAYLDIVKDLNDSPQFISSPRGMKVKEIIGYQFRINNPRDRIPYVSERELSIHYLVAELLWYLSGNDSTEWISNYSSFWSKISDDGSTANSAYGSRIFKPHPRIAEGVDATWNQWKYVIDELKSDHDSRRAVIHIRSPQDSILAKLDVPCTLSLQFFLREDKVHMVASMRSSDVVLGLAYDVPAFTLFQELLAVELTKELGRQIGLGTYTHVSASLHVYERHFGMVERILKNVKDKPKTFEMPPLPNQIPLVELNAFEKKVRSSRDANDIFLALDGVKSSPFLGEDYWNDWCKVLASHKAQKLKLQSVADEILSSTSFGGYRFLKVNSA